MTFNPARTAQTAASDDVFGHQAPTLGWFVKRSVLWMAVLAGAIVAACVLYGAASNAGASAHPQPDAAAIDPIRV